MSPPPPEVVVVATEVGTPEYSTIELQISLSFNLIKKSNSKYVKPF